MRIETRVGGKVTNKTTSYVPLKRDEIKESKPWKTESRRELPKYCWINGGEYKKRQMEKSIYDDVDLRYHLPHKSKSVKPSSIQIYYDDEVINLNTFEA